MGSGASVAGYLAGLAGASLNRDRVEGFQGR